jgi:phage repressor protein C with HTH and peptisase S24 domain
MQRPKKVMQEVPLDDVRRLIAERAEAIGLTLKALSESIGRNPTYLQQYVRYNVPAKGLNDDDRAQLAPLLLVKPEQLRRGAQIPPGIAEELSPYEANPSGGIRPAPTPPRPDHVNKVPVLGTAQAGPDGIFEFNTGEPIDYVARPPRLANNKRVYSIYISGNSMDPIHLDGDLVFVDAGRKPFPGRDALIELYQQNEGEPLRAFIKRVEKVTNEYIELREYQPKERTFRLKHSQIKNLHLVLRNTDMY